MAYADYNYYTNTFLGTLTEEEFTPLAERASDYIDFVTFGRAAAAADTDAVKKCCCALVDASDKYDNHGGGKSSEDIDGYKVSYIAGVSKIESRREAMYNTAIMYLSELMYRGCGC